MKTINKLRAASAKKQYAGSALFQRNQKLSRGAKLCAIKAGAVGTEKFDGSLRVMTAREYFAPGSCRDTQISLGREAHLLIDDFYNPGQFQTVEIFDEAIDQEVDYCEFDLFIGSVLVSPTTLIYFK